VLFGGAFFHEKLIGWKLLASAVMVAGAMLTLF
jgi:hypothetical protein